MAEKKCDPQTFETAIGRLDEIVGEMESDKLPLEDLIVRYEEGTRLVKLCSERLAAAEKKIAIITRDAAGHPRAEEFEPEEKAAPKAEKVSLF